MDPNANLDEQRRLQARLVNDQAMDYLTRARMRKRIAELAEALDDWISGGGFLPIAWVKGR